MTDREEASALLHDVEGIESRVRELLIYSRISDQLFLWGAIWFFGYTATYFFRATSDTMWLFLQAFGLLGTVALVALHIRNRESPGLWFVGRALLMVIGVMGFGMLWVNLAHMEWREQITFWPSLLGFLLFMVGLWSGRAIAFAGFALFAATLLGYFIAGPYLHLWMAVAGGGAMIGGGIWLRR